MRRGESFFVAHARHGSHRCVARRAGVHMRKQDQIDTARRTVVRITGRLRGSVYNLPKEVPDMNITNIRTFLTVIQTKTISQAASLLYVSQSTVSSRLQQLEDEMGVVLIERKKGMRGVELTEKGKNFIPLAERWMLLSKETDYYSHNESEVLLTIAASDSLNTFLFPPLFHALLQNEEKLKLRICSPSAQVIYQMIDGYEADIGFVHFASRYVNIVTKPIMDEAMVLLCSSRGEWPDRPIAPDELDPSFEVNLRWSHEVETWHDAHWNPTVRPYVKLETVSIIDVFFDNPRCWALCSNSVALKLVQAQNNVRVLQLTEEIPRRICYQVMRKNQSSQSSASAEMFERYFDEFIESRSYIRRI